MKKINKKFGQAIDIEWLDAQTYAGWHDPADLNTAEEDVVCQTRGFFCGQDKDYVLIAHTKGKYNPAEGEVCGCMKIPKGMIIKVK